MTYQLTLRTVVGCGVRWRSFQPTKSSKCVRWVIKLTWTSILLNPELTTFKQLSNLGGEILYYNFTKKWRDNFILIEYNNKVCAEYSLKLNIDLAVV